MPTSTIFDLAEAVIEFAVGNEANWNSFQLPIPENVLVYTADTKRFKRGDGIHKFSELPDGPSLAGVLAGEQNIINVLTTLVPNDTNAIIIIDNEIYKPSTTKLSDIAARLAAIAAKDVIQDANMDAIVNQFTLVDTNITNADNNKLAAIGNHKMKPGIDPSTFVVTVPSSPLSVISVGFFSDMACTKLVTKFYHDSTWYVKINASHDTVDTDLLGFTLADTNINTTITTVGRGIFKVVVASIATDTTLTMTASAIYGTDTASSVATIPVSAASLMLISIYGGSGNDIIMNIDTDTAGNIYCTGYTYSEGVGGSAYADAIIVKYDSNLNILAKKHYGGSNDTAFMGIAVDSSNNIYASGYTRAEGTGSYDALIVKFDSNLNILIRKIYGGSQNDFFYALSTDTLGNVICSGYTSTEGAGTPTYVDALVVKFDSNLNLIARKIYGGATGDESFRSVTTDASNNIICSGYTVSEGLGSADALIVKFDVNLNIIARKRYGGTGGEYFNGVVTDTLGNIICSGITNSEGLGSYDIIVVKFDSNLNIIAKKRYGGTATEVSPNNSIAVDSSNNIYVVGTTQSEGAGSGDCVIVKLDTNLNVLTTKRYGGLGDDGFNTVTIDVSGNIICGGGTTSVSAGSYDHLVAKFPNNISTGTFTSSILSGMILADITTMVLSDSMLTLANSTLTLANSTLTLADSILTLGNSTLAQIFDDITLDNIKITTPITGHTPVLVSVYGGTNNDVFSSVIVDRSGNIVCIGYSSSEGNYSWDGLIVKFDQNLNILAKKHYGGTGDDQFLGVAVDSSNNIYCVGYTCSEGVNHSAGLIIKFDTNLNKLACVSFRGNNVNASAWDTTFNSIVIDSSNTIYCVGSTTYEGSGSTDALIIKFDSNLNVLLKKYYGGTSNDYFNGVVVDSLGNIAVCGYTYSEGAGSPTYANALVMKYDSNLNILARKTYGGSLHDMFYGITVDALNNTICVGWTNSTDCLIVKFDTNLAIIARKTYGEAVGDDGLLGVAVDSANNIYVVGHTYSEGVGSPTYDDGLFIKFDTNLNILAKKRYGGSVREMFLGICIDSLNNAYGVGWTQSVGSGGQDTLIVKLPTNISVGNFGSTILTGMTLADSNLTLTNSSLTLADSNLGGNNSVMVATSLSLTLANSTLTQRYDEISFDGIIINPHP